MSANNNPNGAPNPAEVSPIPPRGSGTTTGASSAGETSPSSPNVQAAPTQIIATPSVQQGASNNNGESNPTNAANPSNNAANSSETTAGNGDTDTTAICQPTKVGLTSAEKKEWKLVNIIQYKGGTSNVYLHLHEVNINQKLVSFYLVVYLICYYLLIIIVDVYCHCT